MSSGGRKRKSTNVDDPEMPKQVRESFSAFVSVVRNHIIPINIIRDFILYR